MGRKNHYGSKSLRGTQVAALFYMLCESAKLVGVDPHTYLFTATEAAVAAPRHRHATGPRHGVVPGPLNLGPTSWTQAWSPRRRAILNALIAGDIDPEPLTELTHGRLKAPRADLRDALQGRITDHHRFMLKLHLTQIDRLETAVATIEARTEDALGPFAPPSAS